MAKQSIKAGIAFVDNSDVALRVGVKKKYKQKPYTRYTSIPTQ